jgi:hypothetical protein
MAVLVVVIPIAAWSLRNQVASRGMLDRLRAQGLPTSPAELNRWYAQVPPRENLALPILEAAGAVRSPVQKGSSNFPYFSGRGPWPGQTNAFAGPPHPVSPDELARWRKVVDGMPEAWAAMERARGRRLSRYPIDLRMGFMTLLPHLSQTKLLVQACSLRALVAMEEGKASEAALALEDGLLVHESLLPEPLLISQLVAVACLSIVLDATTDVLSAGPLPVESLERMQRRLESFATTNRYAQAMVGEMSCVMEVFHGSPISQARVWGAGGLTASTPTGAQLAAGTLMALYSATGLNAADERFYVSTIQQKIDASRLPWPDALKASPRMEELFSDSDGGLAGALKGRMKSRMILSGLASAMSKEGESIARLRLGAAMFAIERFRAAHDDRLPGRLEELVPAYLASVPVDPFDGKPIRYKPSAQGYTLHSIGRDLRDDDAKPQARGRSGAYAEQDVVLRVRRAQP